MQNHRGIPGRIWIAGLLFSEIFSKVGCFRTLRFLGSANYLMWRKAVLRWKMTTDHPVEKLGTKVMNSLDWTVQAFVDGRISTEALPQPDVVESILKVLDAKAGWFQEDESKLLLRKALFSVERGKDESLRQYTTRRLAQIEAASGAALVTMPTTSWGTVRKEGARLSKQSEQNLNTLLNGSTELDDVARALNMLDVESQEGIIKGAVKPVAHTFMEAGRFSENQPCEEETEEPDEQSGEEGRRRTLSSSGRDDGRQLDCPDWRRRPQRSEAVDSFIATSERAAQAYWGPGPGTQEGSTKGSRIFLIAYNSAKSCEWFPAAATVNASVFDFHGR